jgi:hypothetical protein
MDKLEKLLDSLESQALETKKAFDEFNAEMRQEWAEWKAKRQAKKELGIKN